MSGMTGWGGTSNTTEIMSGMTGQGTSNTIEIMSGMTGQGTTSNTTEIRSGMTGQGTYRNNVRNIKYYRNNFRYEIKFDTKSRTHT